MICIRVDDFGSLVSLYELCVSNEKGNRAETHDEFLFERSIRSV